MNPEVLDKEARYIQRFSVRTYESDHCRLLRPVSLLNYFQESASDHAEKLGAGVIELMRQNLTWVISRYHIRLYRYPRWKESVELATWPCLNQGLSALREFEVRDEKGSPGTPGPGDPPSRPVCPRLRLAGGAEDKFGRGHRDNGTPERNKALCAPDGLFAGKVPVPGPAPLARPPTESGSFSRVNGQGVRIFSSSGRRKGTQMEHEVCPLDHQGIPSSPRRA